jgi:hypothetical protein
MNPFGTDADCVRYVKTFRAMDAPSKALDLCFVLAPIGYTWIAWVRRENATFSYLWAIVAAGAWLFLAKIIANYVRGFAAERSGVPPTPADGIPGLEAGKWLAIFAGVFAGVCIALDIVILVRTHGHGAAEFTVPTIVTLAFFLQSLSMHTRERFANLVM